MGGASVGGGASMPRRHVLLCLLAAALLVSGLLSGLAATSSLHAAKGPPQAMDILDIPGQGVGAQAMRQIMAIQQAVGIPQAAPQDAESIFDLVAAPYPAYGLPGRAPPSASLSQALERYAAEHGASFDADHPALRRLGLDEEGQAHLAALLDAFTEAGRLQQASLSHLTDDEVALLALDPAAVDAWSAAHPDAGFLQLQQHLAGLADRVDLPLALEASRILTDAGMAARQGIRPSAQPPPVPVSLELEHLIEGALGSAGEIPPVPDLSLPQALVLLAAASGQAPPEQVPTLPASVERAVAQLVLAQAWNLRHGDPVVGALLLLRASEEAAPVLQAWSSLRQAGLDLGTALPSQAADEEPVPLPGPVSNATSSTTPTSTPPLPTGPPDLSPLPDDVERQLVDGDEDGFPDALELVLGTDEADPKSRPAGNLPLFPPTPGPALLIGRLGQSADEPALLVIEAETDDLIAREALVRIDLGGDDTYLVPVGNSRNFLFELAGNDTYDTPGMSDTQGSAQGTGAAILLDLAGNDLYIAESRSQGSSCCGSQPPLPRTDAVDPENPLPDPASFAWDGFDQAFGLAVGGSGGLGLLADLAGDDFYRAGGHSQGYANNLLLTAPRDLLSRDLLATASLPEGSRGFAGILFDGTGDDRYRFATQGFAERSYEGIGPHRVDDGGRAVGLFVDGSGDDQYDNADLPIELAPADLLDLTGLFRSQGYARTEGNAELGPSPAGFFLDLGGRDEYRIPTEEGTLWVPAPKNDKIKTSDTPVVNLAQLGGASEQSAPQRLFVDQDPQSIDPNALDDDGDTVPTYIELLAGTDPSDADDTPTTLLGDPTSLEGTLLRLPNPLGGLPVQPPVGLRLPGLLIGGTGDDVYDDAFAFVVELGGNDVYRGAGHCGARVPWASIDLVRPPAVSFCLDLGGNDTYAPKPAEVIGVNPIGWTFAFAIEPSLGAAHAGVAVLMDFGGNNSFNASVSARARTPEDQPNGAAAAVAMGTSQGAGVLGGVGVLLVDGVHNTFTAQAYAVAEDTQTKPHEEAFAYGVAQGAGYLGVGILANLADSAEGTDHYAATAQTKISPSPTRFLTINASAAQGAGLDGVGVLLDRGGMNTFEAPQGFAQGLGWGYGRRLGTTSDVATRDRTVNYPVEEYGAPRADNTTDTRGGYGQGLMILGNGVDVLSASGPAQGAGGGFWTFEPYVDTGTSRETLQGDVMFHLAGGAGTGILVNLGGDDEYEVPHQSGFLNYSRQGEDWGRDWLVAQAAATPGSIGALLDFAGNDLYKTGPGSLSQAATIGGWAVLADAQGQDRYVAADRAQGYAESAPPFEVRSEQCLYPFAVGVYAPCWAPSLTGKAMSRGSQVVTEADAPATTLGLLLDLEGLDTYRAGQAAQGVAMDALHYLAGAAFCRGPREPHILNPPVDIGQYNVAACPVPEGNTTERTPQGEKITEGTHNILPGSRNNPDFIPAQPLGPPARGPLVGLLIDADGTDVYDYADDRDGDDLLKEPLALTRPGPNDWSWRQAFVPARNLDQTGIPDNPFTGPIDENGVTTRAQNYLLWATIRDNYPDGLPDAALPVLPLLGSTFPMLGGGVDASTLKAALDALSDSDVQTVRVELHASMDPEGMTPVTGDVRGEIYLHATAQVPDGLTVQRLDIVSDRGLLGRAEALAGGSYRYRWVTDALDASAQVPSPLTPDGAYVLWAAARVTSDQDIALDVGRTVESSATRLRVDNPPRLDLALSQDFVSARTTLPEPEPVDITVDVGPDVDPDLAGSLAVRLESLDGELVKHLRDDGPVQAGRLTFSFDGRCGSTACADGVYRVVATVVDVAGQPGQPATALLRLDSQAPISAVLLPTWVGTEYEKSPLNLEIPWSLDDHGHPLVNSTVDLFLLGPEDEVQQTWPNNGPGVRSALYSPVFTGDTLRLLTVARDEAGNREAPCLPMEVEPCFRAALAQQREVHIDFDVPSIGTVGVSMEGTVPGLVRPRATPQDPVAWFNATVSEVGSSLASVTLGIEGETQTHALVQGENPGEWSFDGWNVFSGTMDAARLGTETQVVAQLLARDQADNEDVVPFVFQLDGRPPRLAVQPVAYYSDPGEGTIVSLSERDRLLVARPGAYALVAVAIEDASLEAGMPGIEVQVNAASITNSTVPVNLQWQPATQLWAGLMQVSATSFKDPTDPFPDGRYSLPIFVRDAAGNTNTSAADVDVSSSVPVVGELSVLSVGSDHAVVGWLTKEPATTQARFGRTAAALNRESAFDGSYVTQHIAVLQGLAPSTSYLVQGESLGQNGIVNKTALRTVRTASEIEVEVIGPKAGDVYGAVLPVTFTPHLRDGTPVEASVSFLLVAPAQEGLSPVPLLDLAPAAGTRSLNLDLRQVEDGQWSLRVVASLLGDVSTTEIGPFWIDREHPFVVPEFPLPGRAVANLRPDLIVEVGDPNGQILRDWAATATLKVDGNATLANITNLPGTSGGQSVRLGLTLPGDLAEGRHEVSVSVQDAGGNVVTTRWPFLVDVSLPRILEGGLAGPAGPALSPGQVATVRLRLEDAAGVQAATLNRTPLGLEPLALSLRDGWWSASWDVPANIGALQVPLNVTARDRAGNQGAIGNLTFAVDLEPPRLDNLSIDAGWTTLELRLKANEAVRIQATATQQATQQNHTQRIEIPLAHATATAHFTGLRPGLPVGLNVTLTDAAGHTLTQQLTTDTLPDAEPPGRPLWMQAHPIGEGEATVEWGAAQDNAGIAAYETRVGAAAWTPAGNASARLAQVQVPAGRDVAVAVRAIDVGGLPGDLAETVVRTPAFPHLAEPRVETLVASAAKPVRFEVLYRHAGGDLGNVTLVIDGESHAMRRESGDCSTGCVFTVSLRLPATQLYASAGTFHFEATLGNETVATPAQRLPVVTAAQPEGLMERLAPAPLAAWTLLLLLALVRRRRP